LQQLIVKFVSVCNKLKKKNHLISFDYLFFDEPCKVFTGLFYVPVKYYRCHGTIWPKGHNLASSFGGG
jgi:hypothetical protein